MYFFSDEERKLLLKSYLPKARQLEIAEELRGWNWHEAPLAPIYNLTLAIFEAANGYCPTYRDLFLRRVSNIKTKPNIAMAEGAILHQTLAHVFVKAKELIYHYGPDHANKILPELAKEDAIDFSRHEHSLSKDERETVQKKAKIVFTYEMTRINARLTELLTKQPYIGKDSLAALAVPVVVEQKLDGRFLGLSPNLSADAYTFHEPMILDLKFGEPKDFHRLATTGYALVMEAIHEYPVNIGCIVYAKIVGERLIIQRDFHIIDDELRQWFIETRDEKARMIYEGIDPGVASDCAKICPYYSHCLN